MIFIDLILVEKYSFIVDNTAEKQIEEFIKANNSFDEYVKVN